MKYIVDKIIRIIDEQNSLYSEVDILKMRLGFEILIHNILMIGTILIVAFVCDIFYESVVLLFVYGLLKLNAGGIHCKTSSGCLISTLVFVLGGVYMGKKLDIDLLATVIIYDFCTVVLYFIAPQGTSNNPVSKENYSRLKKNTVIICIVCLILTIIFYLLSGEILNLLVVAVVFETVSVLLGYLRKMYMKSNVTKK